VEPPAWTTLPNVGAADRGRHWAQRQVVNDAWEIAYDRKSWRALYTTRGRSSVPVSESEFATEKLVCCVAIPDGENASSI